jgi:hypothetical protein
MFLRKSRWLSAGVVAAVAALATPAPSRADTQILVQEYNGSNAAVGGVTTFSVAGNGPFNLGSAFSTANFNVSSIGVTPTNFGGSGTLSTTVITNPVSGFDISHYLKVTVTSDGFTNPTPGGVGELVNDPGISTSRTVDLNANTGTTQLFTGPIGSLNPFSPDVLLSDTQTTNGADARSSSPVAAVPGQYTIQQTMTIRLIPVLSTNGTFTDTLSSSLDASPPIDTVPAPAGLVLALTALPVVGLRRALRRKVAA